MCELLLNLSIGLTAGLISGFIVYIFIRYRENQKWKLVKVQLVKSLDYVMNKTLTSIRTAIEIKVPIEVTNIGAYVNFVKKELAEKFDSHKIKFEYLDQKKRDTLLSDFQDIQNSLKQLNSLFIGFRAADPWYAEVIFELQNKINHASSAYIIFPEINIFEHNNNPKLKNWREMTSDGIYELITFVIGTKNNSFIQDLTINKKRKS